MATRNPIFETRTRFVLENITVYYAKVFEENIDEYKGKKKWKITLALDADTAAKMEDQGFNVKYDDDGNAFIEAMRNKETQAGKELDPPEVFFNDGTPYDINKHGLIGNGSVAHLHVNSVYTKVGKNTYLPLYLDKVELVDHIPYGDVKTAAEVLG